MSAKIMKNLFTLGSFVVIIAGALMAFFGSTINDEWEEMYAITGPIILVVGVLFLLTAIFSKNVSESTQAKYLGIIMIFGSILAIVGIFGGEMAGLISIGGSIFIVLVFLIWPCICLQGGKSIRSKIIGVANAHERITISEISKITGLDEPLVRDTIYDAIGQRQLSGNMTGDTFVRSGPSSTAYTSSMTREREVVKVLVICPYCGAKTEQGVGKCQNCQADL
ncbi:hypothetical protein EU527_12845 [Candidatus Thorarchaeota archaeon]|nr:MAG: hypothetical protein EU527_12845 [Candidatus Thorarchaeota archaeon]